MIKLTDILKEIVSDNFEIFCDMDGVLTDFVGDFERRFGQDMNSHKDEFGGEEKMWQLIDGAGEPYWSEMSWMKDGKKLWDYINRYRPKIISSPSQSAVSKTGKQKWVERELGDNEVILVPAEEKPNYATSNAILIDDREDTVQEWREKGGIGILHTSAEDTIKQLQSLGL